MVGWSQLQGSRPDQKVPCGLARGVVSSRQTTEQGGSWPIGSFSLLQCNSLLPFPNLSGKVCF